MKPFFLSLLLTILLCSPCTAAHVDTVWITPSAMPGKVRTCIVIPQGKRQTKCPVIYLLHGYANDGTIWLRQMNLRGLADRYGVIFACPDGQNSWYWDSPVNPASRYETFVSKDLPRYVDSHYNTIASRRGRAITGFSMGGHGALWNAIRHPDVFGAAGSSSGGVDVRPWPGAWAIAQSLGPMEEAPERWDAHCVVNLVDSLEDGELKLFIDCGYEDFFFGVNNDLHERLMKRKIAHTFLVAAGKHDWNYWKNSFEQQFLFFYLYFTRGK